MWTKLKLYASRERYRCWQSERDSGLVGAAPAGAAGQQRGSSGAAAGRECGQALWRRVDDGGGVSAADGRRAAGERLR